jgi:hypothetical protein
MGMEPDDVPLTYIKQVRKGYFALHRASDGAVLAQSANPRELQAVSREFGYRQPGPDPQKYAASRILSEASHSAILKREALIEQQKILQRESKPVAKRGPSEHPGDKWLRKRDRQDPTRGEMSRRNQEVYDSNIAKAKAAYEKVNARLRAGLGNRGGKGVDAWDKQPSPRQPQNTAAARKAQDDAKSRRIAEQQAAKEARLMNTPEHGLVLYRPAKNEAVKVASLADARKFAKKEGLQITNTKEYLAAQDQAKLQAKAPKPPGTQAMTQAAPTARARVAPHKTNLATQHAEKVAEAKRNMTSKKAAEIALRNFPDAHAAMERGAERHAAAKNNPQLQKELEAELVARPRPPEPKAQKVLKKGR